MSKMKDFYIGLAENIIKNSPEGFKFRDQAEYLDWLEKLYTGELFKDPNESKKMKSKTHWR